jgi:hypothetical protein
MCIDLEPDQRDKIMCLYPNDTCEATQVLDEVKFTKKENGGGIAIAPVISIYAILCANPL